MTKESTKMALLQGSNEECETLFREYMREQVRGAIWEVMEEEVKWLCGPKYRPAEQREYRRAGSEQGVVYLGGKRQKMVRPRVRRRGTDGLEREVALRTYQGARRTRRVEAEVAECMVHGMSTRSFARMKLDGLSASEVSRRWVSVSVRKMEELKARNLAEEDFFGLILDGVFLTREIVVLVCVGLRRDGRKRVLGFAVGSSENLEVAREIIRDLVKRGFKVPGQLFALIDGSPALEKALLEQWPDARIQRCLVHKERNLHAHLRRKDHAECSRLMDRLRKAEGATAGREALGELQHFLAAHNQEALLSLQEAGDKLITLHLLNVPATLNRSLLSTNLIENVMRNYRRQTGRVCRWRSEGDQVARWSATALLWAEEGFRKITGYEHLPALLAALGFPPAPPSGPAGHPSLPARVAPTPPERGCHAPCSDTPALEPVRSSATFLPPTGEGGQKVLRHLSNHKAKSLTPNTTFPI